jgi:hypothetical protein
MIAVAVADKAWLPVAVLGTMSFLLIWSGLITLAKFPGTTGEGDAANLPFDVNGRLINRRTPEEELIHQKGKALLDYVKDKRN